MQLVDLLLESRQLEHAHVGIFLEHRKEKIAIAQNQLY
jgi:hypothetical protein